MDTANSQLGLDYESIYTYIWKQNSDIVKYVRILFSHLHNILDTAYVIVILYAMEKRSVEMTRIFGPHLFG